MKLEVSQQHYICLKFRAFQNEGEKSSRISQRMFYSLKNCWEFLIGKEVTEVCYPPMARWQTNPGFVSQGQTADNKKGHILRIFSCYHTTFLKKGLTFKGFRPLQANNLYSLMQATRPLVNRLLVDHPYVSPTQSSCPSSTYPLLISDILKFFHFLNRSCPSSNYYWDDSW